MDDYPFELKFLKDCTPCDLVKVKIEDTSEWAIVGKRESTNFFPLIVVSGTRSPFGINISLTGRIDGDFDTYPALNFGTNYDLTPDYLEDCQIGVGEIFKRPGALVLSGKDRYMVVNVEGKSKIRFFDISTGYIRSEPGGDRCAFAGWKIWSKALTRDVGEKPLLAWPASK